jgi:WD40 repeat protein
MYLKRFNLELTIIIPKKGLAAVSTTQDQAILVIPGRQKGHLQVIDLNSLQYYISVSESLNNYQRQNSNTRRSINVSLIGAHSGKLSCIAVNPEGTKCATASDKGTLVRVFNTSTGTLLHELRRGMDKAEIYSIAFNTESTRLAVSSDKGTIHVFNLDSSVIIDHKSREQSFGESPKDYGLTNSGNRGSALGFMKDLLPKYFSSEWSFAHAKIATESRCLAAFGNQKNSIIGKSRHRNVLF